MNKVEVTCLLDSDGKVSTNQTNVKNAFKSFAGKQVTITINQKFRKRSSPQNRYYWGCIIPIVKEEIKNLWGELWSSEQTHHFLKNKFNVLERINDVTGELITVPKSTSENDTFDQEQYHEKIRQFAYEWLNTTIPLPNENVQLL